MILSFRKLTKEIPVEEEVNFQSLSQATAGFTGGSICTVPTSWLPPQQIKKIYVDYIWNIIMYMHKKCRISAAELLHMSLSLSVCLSFFLSSPIYFFLIVAQLPQIFNNRRFLLISQLTQILNNRRHFFLKFY